MRLYNFLSDKEKFASYGPAHSFELCGKSYRIALDENEKSSEFTLEFYDFPSKEIKIQGLGLTNDVTAAKCFKAGDDVFIISFSEEGFWSTLVLDLKKGFARLSKMWVSDGKTLESNNWGTVSPPPAQETLTEDLQDFSRNVVDWTLGSGDDSTIRIAYGGRDDVGFKAKLSLPKGKFKSDESWDVEYRAINLRDGVFIHDLFGEFGGHDFVFKLVADFTYGHAFGVGLIVKKGIITFIPIGCYGQVVSYEE